MPGAHKQLLAERMLALHVLLISCSACIERPACSRAPRLFNLDFALPMKHVVTPAAPAHNHSRKRPGAWDEATVKSCCQAEHVLGPHRALQVAGCKAPLGAERLCRHQLQPPPHMGVGVQLEFERRDIGEGRPTQKYCCVVKVLPAYVPQ